MKKILTFVFTLLTFVTFSQLNQIDVKKAYVRNWLIYQGDTLAIVSISGDTIFVTRGATLDTLPTNGVWTKTGNNIENNNTGKVIIPGDSTFFDVMPDVGTKVGRILHVNQYKEIEYITPTSLGDRIDSGRAASPTAYTTWIRGTNKLYPATVTDSIAIGGVTPTEQLDVRGNAYFYSDAISEWPFHFVSEHDTVAPNTYNLRSQFFLTTDDSIPYRIGGVLGESNIRVATTKYVSEAVGTYGYVQHYPTTILNSGIGAYNVVANRGVGTINNVYGTFSAIYNTDAGHVEDIFGHYVSAVTNSGGGTIDNIYGLYLRPQSEGDSSNYGIYQEGANNNYFGGTISMPGTTATTGIININANRFIHSYLGSNSFLGFNAGNLSMTSTHCTGVGYQSLIALTTGANNSAFGSGSLYSNTEGYGNSAFGYTALYLNTTGYHNTAMGFQTLYYQTARIGNTAVGAFALGSAIVAGDNNTSIGYYSGTSNTSGAQNTNIGANAGRANATGSFNVFVGSQAGRNATGGYCTFVGDVAGYNTTSGISNSAFGMYALYGSGAMTGANNTALGYSSLYTVTGAANNNTAVGMEAGYSLTSGDGNVFIGYQAGYSETGSNKLYISNTNTATPLIKGDFTSMSLNIYGVLYTGSGIIADNDSTPSVAAGNTFVYSGSANSVSIDALDDHIVGAYYTIFGNSETYTITIPDGSVAGGDSFNLAGAWVGGIDDCITLYCKAADTFKEVSRSNN